MSKQLCDQANRTLADDQSWSTTQKNIATLGLWTFSLFFDVIIILVILKSISKLTRIEFYILCTIAFCSTLFKLTALLVYVIIYFNIMLFGQYTSVVILGIAINSNFVESMMIFFYSLYHVTFLKRSNFFVKLSNAIQQPRTLLIYIIAVVVISIVISSSCLVIVTLQTQAETHMIGLSMKLIEQKSMCLLIFLVIIPAFLPSLIYSIATLITFFSRLRAKRTFSSFNQTLSNIQMKRFRKNLSLFSKFLLLGVFNILYVILKTLYQLISVYSETNNQSLLLLNYFGDFFFLTMTIFLIFIHRILRQTLKKVFKDIFNFFYRSN